MACRPPFREAFTVPIAHQYTGTHLAKFVMRSGRARGDTSSLAVLAQGLVVSSLIIAFLYIGREILEPLVIAALLAFILSPLIRRLRQWGVWRIPSVVISVIFALGVLAALLSSAWRITAVGAMVNLPFGGSGSGTEAMLP